jgi:REP element-mobilizing transposase RayT
MAARSRQQNFGGFKKLSDSFGGSLLKNSHAKTKRPLDSKLPIHLVLRATRSGMRLPKTLGRVNETVFKVAKKHGVRIYEFANVGNHLHVLIKIPRRPRWAAFIRELTGRLAQIVQGIAGQERGAEKFWKHRPFTRVVKGWQKAFRLAREYVGLNQLEADGMINRTDTKTLKDLRAIFDTA